MYLAVVHRTSVKFCSHSNTLILHNNTVVTHAGCTAGRRVYIV